MLPGESWPRVLRRSWATRAINVVLCFLSAVFVFVYFRKYVYFFPITVESLWQIFLAEINRVRNKRRVHKLKEGSQEAHFIADEEKGPLERRSTVQCLASVVGYREEAGLFRRCLESYRDAPSLGVMLVGIDGNEATDMEMVQIVKNVFGEKTTTIAIKEPLGLLAIRLAREYAYKRLGIAKGMKSNDQILGGNFDDLPEAIKEEARQFAMQEVYALAVNTLEAHDLLDLDSRGFRPICIHQPHVCKKDIMFTNFIFSLALGRANDVEYLWTSDSDTLIFPDTLFLTIGCMAADPLIGGSCGTLAIHNEDDSMIARLGSAAYWSELAITRGQTGAVDSVDCQPGPCASFKLLALEPILFQWYTQTSLGIKTVVNEDRHLTTKLLLDGWKVTFNTQALALTDTPKTLIRWLLQQMRWARATHIETFQYPSVYSIHGPILFVTAMRRFYGPLAIGIFTIRYVVTGEVVHAYSLQDVACRVVLCTVYNFLCNRQHAHSLFFLMISQIFYQLPLPGIIFWSTVTVLEGSWGTRMRSQREAKKRGNVAMENVGAVAAVVVWMGFVAACMARYLTSRLAPGSELAVMLLSAVITMVTLFCALVRSGLS